MKKLPPRFQKVADCILAGRSEKEIPALTGLSFATVRSYVRTMYKKLGVHNRAEFAVKVLSLNTSSGG